MTNARISLDGTWEFLHVSDDQVPGPMEVRSITVPGPWQAQFADLRMRAGVGIYRRAFTLPAGWKHDRVRLVFGAVFHNTKVWVNGTPVGGNQGGFLPFAFDVTEQVVEGENEIKVRVESPTDNPAEFPDSPLGEIPFGKQSWYGPLSGIWQSVHLECRVADRISRMRIRPELGTGEVQARVFFASPLPADTEVDAVILDPDGKPVAAAVVAAKADSEEVDLSFAVDSVRAWSPDAPNLYRLVVTTLRGGAKADGTSEAFGFRTIETRDGRFLLNGEPLYLRAALDQDYYPDMICTVPSVEFLEDQFRKAKELGLNCLRIHIKAADPRYYEVADRLGLLVWTELPNGGLSTERSRGRKEALLKGIVDRDGNHPSIVIWTIINENWGVDLVHDADHRAWLKRTFAWLKAYDPTRLVVDNSPLAPSFHVETDIADYHYYANIPDHRANWDAFVDRLASREAFLYSQEGDAVITGQEPVICSEFGNWGLPDPRDLRDAAGNEPWWFETGHDWGDGIMYPHGVEIRFSDWSLDRFFGSLKAFIEAAQWQQFRALKYEIEAMRRRPELAGYVITEFTDCHWESNGLLDMRRNRRVFHERFSTINADTVIVPQWERTAYWGGETIRLGCAIAHGGKQPIEGARLEFGLSDVHRVDVPAVQPGAVVDLGAIEVIAPRLQEAGTRELSLRLVGPDGAEIATNTVPLSLHPQRTPADADCPVWSGDADIAEHMKALGYRTVDRLEDAEVAVARGHDDRLRRFVRGGGSMILVAETEMALEPLFPHWQNVRVQERNGTHWGGDWASSFAWQRRTGPFEALPGGPLIDESFDRVIPTHVISGCNLIDFQARVHAGLVVGWIHKPVALTVERGYGNGHVVASTFRLFRDAAGADPIATQLIRGLVTLAVRKRASRAAIEDAA
ncbi:glycoside hydrolase family 2 protein [Chthonobacter albigriseus]|uniref:glycoside hydrolase family 2 protein n=1 Tax=Chthonobacter albigriseus TaxID=1683161 RepID=UPI0015EECB0A|nr:sugar-binding domain-containing protein [Chthonobacter albigriseus]